MDYLYLTIPHTEFIEKTNNFIKQLDHINPIKRSLRDETYNKKIIVINDNIISFLKESFSNEYPYQWYISQMQSSFYDIDHDPQKIKNILIKLLEEIKRSDTAKFNNENLFEDRQSFTVKQKRDFLILELSKRPTDIPYNVKDIYKFHGLKKSTSNEYDEIAQQLEDKKYAKYSSGIGSQSMIQINLKGLEYSEGLNKEAFASSPTEKRFSSVEKKQFEHQIIELKKDLTKTIKDEFAEQKDFLLIALNALHEITEESIQLVESKLPKKTIKQAIIGAIISKAGDKSLDIVLKMIWEGLKDKLIDEPSISGLLSKAEKLIGN